MRPDTADTTAAPPAGTSTDRGHQPGREPVRLLAAAETALAGISGTARHGGLDATAALAAITAARKLAAELEHGELAFIEAARSGGATWSQIAAAMGAGNRQTAQKRHADLARRCPCPPSADMSAPPEPRPQETGHDDSPASTSVAGTGNIPGPAPTSKPAPAREKDRPPPPPVPVPAPAASPAPPARSPRKQPLITSAIIAQSQYKLVRATGHHETHAWHVLVGGTLVGLVRPTWRAERSRPGWEPVDDTGLALPATGIGRVTRAGNARTRDAAAAVLLRALQRQQENDRKRRR